MSLKSLKFKSRTPILIPLYEENMTLFYHGSLWVNYVEEGRENKKGEKEKKRTEGRNMFDLQGNASSTNLATQVVLREF